MIASTSLYFEPSARLQRLLSKELISDPNLAVVELVKNGYDAGATKVIVDLRGGNVENPARLLIADNGSGMSEAEFKSSWMRPGYSEKARHPGRTIRVGGGSRVPVGEKGLGRLAAGRLGERLTVYTRRHGERDWFKLVVDWPRFDNMDEALQDVKFESERVLEAPIEAFESGTVLVIENLTVDLTARVPGRKVAGRPDNRFGRLAQDLRLLTIASGGEQESNFIITLRVDDPHLQKYAGSFGSIQSLSEGQFLYDFSISLDRANHLYVSRRVTQGESGRGGAQDLLNIEGPLQAVGETTRVPHPRDLSAGPISGRFVYAPPARGQRVSQISPSGVFLYRDRVRVEPYGEPEADWVGAYSRKASRQGYAPIQPKHLYGSVHITRSHNPDLTDMSNRQGLIENEEFENLVAHVRAEFAFFEKVVQDHEKSPRWQESQARKRRAAAQERVSVTRAQSRSLAHSVRQPLTGLGASLFVVQQVSVDSRLPEDLREKLAGALDGLRRAAADISERVQTFLQASGEDVTDFDLEGVFQETVDRVSAIADAQGAHIDILSSKHRISFARSVLVEALVELTANALAAEDVDRRDREITLSAELTEAAIEIRVADNGPGLPESRRDHPFEPGMSQSGRPGHGLITQKLTLLGAGADIELQSSSTEGACFCIIIPRSIATLDLS